METGWCRRVWAKTYCRTTKCVCVCDGGWGLHLLPLSCCQAGVQPTAPGPKPSRRQARTTGERGGGKQKESIKIERWEGRIRSGNQKTRAGEESGEEEDDGNPGEKAARREEGTKQSVKDGQSQVITLSVRARCGKTGRDQKTDRKDGACDRM